MPRNGKPHEKDVKAATLAALPDDELIDAVQRQTFRFFWEGAHPGSGLAPDRRTTREEPVDDLVATGGSGFGVMAIIVAVERGWVTREEAVERLTRMVDLLCRATSHHGALPHFLHGVTGATIPFSEKDDGGDIVETSLLLQGLLCARQYFDRDETAEAHIRKQITRLWDNVEWNWYTQGRKHLYWHWSPNHGWAMDHEIHGWNECLITYVLAAGSKRHAIEPSVYHHGFCTGPDFLNGKAQHGIELPLGPPFGGPLFFAHYSFCGLDPRGLADRHADYWEQNVRHVRIHHAHGLSNPLGHPGYSDACWGLTASDDPVEKYAAHQPMHDNGTISPTAALSSLPYAPTEVMRALRHFLGHHGDRAWGRFGFVDAFNERLDWYADTYLAIDQGPMVVMMENHRTGLLWKLFMRVPEVQAGLRRLGFTSPHLKS